MEEVSRASAAIGLSYGAHSNLCVNQIVRNGSPEQKARYLPKLISGEHVGALAMSEPGAGSDVVSMKTRAEKKGDRYVLNGAKMWITNGPVADVLLIYAKTDPSGRPARHQRLSRREGLQGLPAGRRSSTRWGCAAPTLPNSCSRIARCRRKISSAASGEGVNVLMSGLDYERAVLAAGPLGIMQAAMDVVLPYVHERKQFGQAIGEFQLIQAKLADMYVSMNASRAYVYAVAKACDRARRRARTPPARSSIPPSGRRRSRSTRSRCSAATATPTITPPRGCCATPSSTRSARGRARSGAC